MNFDKEIVNVPEYEREEIGCLDMCLNIHNTVESLMEYMDWDWEFVHEIMREAEHPKMLLNCVTYYDALYNLLIHAQAPEIEQRYRSEM